MTPEVERVARAIVDEMLNCPDERVRAEFAEFLIMHPTEDLAAFMSRLAAAAVDAMGRDIA